METQGYFAALGRELQTLADDQSRWSQLTFGTDDQRGPKGALKHLAKEAVETERAWSAERFDAAALCEEFADCLLLLLDASRRAGLSPLGLIQAAADKMKVNKSRK